jgi:hypothetical protein
VLVQDSSSKEIKLINLDITPVHVVYPRKEPLVAIDISSNEKMVEEYTSIIESSKVVAVNNIKEVVSISKQVEYNY